LGKLETLWIHDKEDGGCKSDKFERDIALLMKGLEEEPFNERYMFYLAQSYSSIGRYEEAIQWYQKRIERGGWNEEVWCAKYRIGALYQKLENWDEALKWYLDAYSFLPSRAEPLQKIATYYRIQGQYALAYLFAKEGKAIPYPKEQRLFVEDAVYDYMFDEEISIAAYYLPSKKEEGFAANERVLFNKKAPLYVRYQARRNLRFYVNPLLEVSFEKIEIELPRIREDLDLYFNPMNPSICKIEDGYFVICRCVNYAQKGAKYFFMLEPGAPYLGITRNFLLHYDKNFQLISQKEIFDNLSSGQKIAPYSDVEGPEDMRLFQYQGGFWVTAALSDLTDLHQPQTALFQIDNPCQETLFTKYFIPLKGPDPLRPEKNWLPFVKNGEIHTIYSYSPFVVHKIDPKEGTCQVVIEEDPLDDLSWLRGSAAPVPFDDGYLGLVHELTFTDSEERVYLHRFFYLDKDHKITKLSKPFTFQHQGVEYCCGLTLDHEEKRVVLSIGIEDREAYLTFLNVDTVRSLLTHKKI
jgi:hypothetical protein